MQACAKAQPSVDLEMDAAGCEKSAAHEVLYSKWARKPDTVRLNLHSPSWNITMHITMLQRHSKQAMLVLTCVYQVISHKYEWADELRNQFSIEDLNASTVSILGDWTSLSEDTEERMTGEDVWSSLSNDVLFGFFPISKTTRKSHDSRNSRAQNAGKLCEQGWTGEDCSDSYQSLSERHGSGGTFGKTTAFPIPNYQYCLLSSCMGFKVWYAVVQGVGLVKWHDK